MDTNTTIKYINDVIRNYINNKKQQKRIANNMYVKHNDNPSWSVEDAFMFEMQSVTSIYTELSISEQEKVASSLWNILKNKNHSLSRLW